MNALKDWGLTVGGREKRLEGGGGEVERLLWFERERKEVGRGIWFLVELCGEAF